MWTCPNCETLNETDVCIICGKNKPSDDELNNIKKMAEMQRNVENISKKSGVNVAPPKKIPAFSAPVERPAAPGGYVPPRPGVPHETEKPKKKKGLIITAAVLAFILILVTFAIGFLEVSYRNACHNMNEKNYDSARNTFRMISFYRNSEVMLEECDYLYAYDLFENNEYDEAKKIFTQLGSYSNSEDLVLECDYKKAIDLKDSGQLFEAYDAFVQLGDYEDSSGKIEDVKALMYKEGISCYRNGSYDEAKKYFDKSYDVGREDDYYTLIDAHSDNASIYDLKKLAGFEDANKLLLKDKYLTDFLMGYWSNGSNKLEFYKNNNGGNTCSFDMPTTVDGPNWEIKNGVLNMGSSSIGWTPQWSYTIINENYISVYCYSNSRTYYLTRR